VTLALFINVLIIIIIIIIIIFVVVEAGTPQGTVTVSHAQVRLHNLLYTGI